MKINNLLLIGTLSIATASFGMEYKETNPSLDYAIENDIPETVKFWIEKKGIDPNAPIAGSNKRPLDLAIIKDSVAVFQYLINRPTYPIYNNENLQHSLDYAAKNNAVKIVQYLVEKKGISPTKATDELGLVTPLHYAAMNNAIDVVKYLINQQNINPNTHRINILHTAAKKDAIDVVRFLIENNKVQWDLKNKEGKTTLDLANDNKANKVIEYLQSRKN